MTNRITLKFDYSQPVELVDISLSLMAFGNEFARYSNSDKAGIPEAKLFLHEMRSGSVIAELAVVAVQGSVFVDNAMAIQGFIVNFKAFVDYFLGITTKKPEIDKRQLDQMESFLNPVTKDTGSSFVITGDHNDVTINYVQANAVQNGIKRERDLLKEPVSGLHDQVVLQFKQTRDDPEVGNRAVIESISKSSVKTIFAEKSVHDMMLMGVENPLTGGYLVSVRVETIDDKPTLYNIRQFYERIE